MDRSPLTKTPWGTYDNALYDSILSDFIDSMALVVITRLFDGVDDYAIPNNFDLREEIDQILCFLRTTRVSGCSLASKLESFYSASNPIQLLNLLSKSVHNLLGMLCFPLQVLTKCSSNTIR